MSHRASGFTLLELLMSVLLLAVGIAWSLQIMVMGLRMSQQTHDELLAANGVAEYYLEYLRSLTFTDPLLNPTPVDGSQCTPLPRQLTQTWTPLLPGATCRYWVVNVDPTPNLKQITVQAGWTDASGRGRSVSATTQLSRPQP